MKAIVVNLILGAVIVVGLGIFAIVKLMDEDRSVLRSWQRQQDLIGWSEKLVAERLGANSQGLVRTKTIQPHGDGNLWTLSGAYGLAGNRNAPSYVAVIEKTCRSSAERRCWQLHAAAAGCQDNCQQGAQEA